MKVKFKYSLSVSIIWIMKKFILLFAVMMCWVFAGNAQNTEITIGYGGYTQMDATDCHDDWSHVNNAWGALTAGVNFRGLGNSSIAYHAIMLNGRYEYYRNNIVTLYGRVGLGAEISHMMPRHSDSYNKTYFAYQFTPLGAQVGISRTAMIFGELGFGAQGLVQVGFRFRL